MGQPDLRRGEIGEFVADHAVDTLEIVYFPVKDDINLARYFFEKVVDLQPRPKPRKTGLTMVVDWGLGLHTQEDTLATASDFFDLAKIAVGIGRLLKRNLLASKIKLYQEHDVEPFPGGQFLEYAHVHGTEDAYLPAVVEAGYRWCEVSDNLASVSLQWKQKIIRQAVDEFGLRVLGEVGRKEGPASDHSMTDNAKACVDAGSTIVLLEAAELVGEDAQTAAKIEGVVAAIGLDKTMFELPGPWIEGVGQSDVHRMRRDLITRFGPQVNLGNIVAGDIVSLEAYRRGLGINAGKPAD